MEALKEGMIIAPATCTASARAALTAELVRHFDGCTITQGEGFWRDPDGAIVREPVLQFVVAGSDRHNNTSGGMLAAIAAQFVGVNMQQAAAYVRTFTGDVYILKRGENY